MMKTILRRIAIVASAILLVMSLYSMIPRSGFATPYLGMLLLALYAVATGLALLAIERPTLDQRLKAPGVVCNVLAVAFPIFAWAKWATGTMNLSVAAGLVPCIGFTLLVIALLWVLEAEKVFKPAKSWAIGAGLMTFASFAVMSAGGSRRYSGNNYADELAFLSKVADIAGLIYAATAIVVAIFLYTGLTGKPLRIGNWQTSEADKARDVEAKDVVQTVDSELKKYDIVAMDGDYEYMGLLYTTREDAIAAAKRNSGEA